jgi:signal peptidase I
MVDIIRGALRAIAKYQCAPTTNLQEIMRMKAVSIICNTLGYMILGFIILVAGGLMLLQSLGYRPLVVLSGSMRPVCEPGGLMIINTNAPPQNIRVGDIITYNNTGDTVVTHRVIEIRDGQFVTKGDANETADLATVTRESFVGQAWLYVPRMGDVLLNIKTKQGLAFGAIILAALIALFATPALLAPGKGGPKQKQTDGSGGNVFKTE